jgi:hypothetical protein
MLIEKGRLLSVAKIPIFFLAVAVQLLTYETSLNTVLVIRLALLLVSLDHRHDHEQGESAHADPSVIAAVN